MQPPTSFLARYNGLAGPVYPVLTAALGLAVLIQIFLAGEELCRKIGDGVNQVADLISATASIPSLNFIPLTTFGNWF